MKRMILGGMLVLAIGSGAFAASGEAGSAQATATPGALGSPTPPGPQPSGTPPRLKRYPLPKVLAHLDTTKGRISIQLYPQDAPNTCANFVKLAEKGSYKDRRFFRVVKGFVIQTGDPSKADDGEGGPGYAIAFEKNSLVHVAGAVGMARDDDMDSAGSQFYITYNRVPHLDGKYVVFAQTIAGFDVVDKIEQFDPKSGKGDKLKDVTIEYVAGKVGVWSLQNGLWTLPE